MSLHQEPPAPAPITDPALTPLVSGSTVPGQLKLINLGPSADGRHVHLHFIAQDNNVVTIQLETTVATGFHSRLGELLLALSSRPVEIGMNRMN